MTETSSTSQEGGKVRQVLSKLSDSLQSVEGTAPASHGLGKLIETGLRVTSEEAKTIRAERKATKNLVKGFESSFKENLDPQTAWNELDTSARDRLLDAFREGKTDYPKGVNDFLENQKTQAELEGEARTSEEARKTQETQEKKDGLLSQVNDLASRAEAIASQQQQIGSEYRAQQALVDTAQTAVDEQKEAIQAIETEKSAPVSPEKAAEMLTTNETGLPQVERNLRDKVVEMTAAVATGNVSLEQLLRLADAGTQDLIIRVWIGEQNPDQAPELAKVSREIVAEGVNKMLEAAKEAVLKDKNEVELRATVESGLVDENTITAIGTALTGELSFGVALSRYHLAEKAARAAAPGLGEGHQTALKAESEKQRLVLVKEIAAMTEKKGQVLTGSGLEMLQQFLGGQTFGYVSENGMVQRILTPEEVDVLSKSAKKSLQVTEKDQLGRSRFVEHKLVSVTDVIGPEAKNVEQASALFAKVVETMLSGSGEAQRDLVASVASESVEKVLTGITEAKKAVAQNSPEYQKLDGQEAILSGVLEKYRQTQEAVMTESQVNGINYIEERIKNEDPAAVFTASELASFIEASDSAPLKRLQMMIRNRAGMHDYDPVLASLKDAYEAGRMLGQMEMSPGMKSQVLIKQLDDTRYGIRTVEDGVDRRYQESRRNLREAGQGDRTSLYEKAFANKDARERMTNLQLELSTLSSRQMEIGTRVTEIIAQEKDIDTRVKLIQGELAGSMIADQFDNPINLTQETINSLKKESKGVNNRYSNLMKKQEVGQLTPEQQEELSSVQEKVSDYKSQIATEEARLRRLEKAKQDYEKERTEAAEALAKQRQKLMTEKTGLIKERGENLSRLGELTKVQGEDGLTEVERAEKATADAKAALTAAREAYLGEWKPKTGDLRWAMVEEKNQLAKKRAVIEAMLYGVQVTAGIAGTEGREKPAGTWELDNYSAEVIRHVEALKVANVEARLQAANVDLNSRIHLLTVTKDRLDEINNRANAVETVDTTGEIVSLKQEWQTAGLDPNELENYLYTKGLLTTSSAPTVRIASQDTEEELPDEAPPA